MRRTGDLGRGIVEAMRGGVVEAVHRFHAVAVRADGARVAWAGDPELVCFLRSSAKPFQALPFVTEGVADRAGATDEELAIVCSSHSGQPRHVAVVESLMRKTGVSAGELLCGPRKPFHKPTGATVPGKGTVLHNNCSGKHAGMVAVAKAKGWPVPSYQEPSHPLQRAILGHVARLTGASGGTIRLGIDGCGVPCHAMSLAEMARAYAVLADPARDPVAADALRRIGEAMRRHPLLVAGEGRLDTRIGETTAGRIVAKAGAEALECLAVFDDGAGGKLGVAVKVEDGGNRGMAPAVGAFLRETGLIQNAEYAAMRDEFEPVVKGAAMDAGVVMTRFEPRRA